MENLLRGAEINTMLYSLLMGPFINFSQSGGADLHKSLARFPSQEQVLLPVGEEITEFGDFLFC